MTTAVEQEDTRAVLWAILTMVLMDQIFWRPLVAWSQRFKLTEAARSEVSETQRRRRILEAIDLIGLDGFEDAFPKGLSGGMWQRVGFARALVVQLEILFMVDMHGLPIAELGKERPEHRWLVDYL